MNVRLKLDLALCILANERATHNLLAIWGQQLS